MAITSVAGSTPKPEPCYQQLLQASRYPLLPTHKGHSIGCQAQAGLIVSNEIDLYKNIAVYR
jgi:hypothetical protein